MHFSDMSADGIHLSYATMASYLAACGNPNALNVARDPDSKMHSLLAEAAG